MRSTIPMPATPVRTAATIVAAVFVSLSCSRARPEALPVSTPPANATLEPAPGETHLRNIRQLTFGGENAEAYFSRDGKKLIFQSTRDGRTCDQQYTMNIDGSDLRRVSTGAGKTTCGYFYSGDRKIS